MEFIRAMQENPYVAIIILGILLGLGYWIVSLAFDDE